MVLYGLFRLAARHQVRGTTVFQDMAMRQFARDTRAAQYFFIKTSSICWEMPLPVVTGTACRVRCRGLGATL
jgi:hypothetical protein